MRQSELRRGALQRNRSMQPQGPMRLAQGEVMISSRECAVMSKAGGRGSAPKSRRLSRRASSYLEFLRLEFPGSPMAEPTNPAAQRDQKKT